MYNRRKRFITDSQPLHNRCDIPILIYILAFLIFDRPFSSRNFLANDNWQHWLLSRVTCFFFLTAHKIKIFVVCLPIIFAFSLALFYFSPIAFRFASFYLALALLILFRTFATCTSQQR